MMDFSNIIKLASFCMAGLLSLILVVFSIVQLIRVDDQQAVYFSLLSSITGIWLPSPTSLMTLTYTKTPTPIQVQTDTEQPESTISLEKIV